MRKNLLLLLLAFANVFLSHAQVIFNEDFESGSLPVGWTQQTNATDGGWNVGTSASLSSQYWPIKSNNSSYIAATNDDGCNCNKSRDYFITPVLSFLGLSNVVLSVDVFFGKGNYQNFEEVAKIEASTNGTSWTVLQDIAGSAGWTTLKIDLSAYANEDSVFIAFHYNDDGGWLYGLAIDNVLVEVPQTLDAKLVKLKSRAFGEVNTSIVIGGTIFNNGISSIQSMDLQYSINNGGAVNFLLDSINIAPYTYFEFVHPIAWTPELAGIYEVKVDIMAVNSTMDQDSTNNSKSFQTDIYPRIVPPNKIDDYLYTVPVYKTIANSTDGLDKPNDLDFFPIMAKNELWVVNERVESTGGSTMTLYDAGTPDQTILNRVDGNAWHFMALPTAIAFSDNFNFATSPGIKDANHGTDTFTGPTLWSSDPEIYAQPSGGNGSHIDMLHGSPFSMGIASEKDNIFWVFDGWNSTIVRYDFQSDHGPGNEDHSNGIVRRYKQIQVKRDGFVPSHLVFDHSSGWLYVVDNGNNRVLRLDTKSGNVINSLPIINEPLAEHSEMGNVTWEVIVDHGLDRPSGIEIIGNRLLVSNYATGDIIVYDMGNNFTELGHIFTGLPGITGIRVGPDGAIWYTNRLENTLVRIEPGEPTATKEENQLSKVLVMPNPTSGFIMIEIPGELSYSGVKIELRDIAGRKISSLQTVNRSQEMNLGSLPGGVYMLTISSASGSITKKVVLKL